MFVRRKMREVEDTCAKATYAKKVRIHIFGAASTYVNRRFYTMDDNITREKVSHIFSNRDLWRLIWPLLVEQLLQITVGMADIIMVASLGEDAVSGVSLVDQINVLLTQLFAALAAGGAVVCSQMIGSGNTKKASDSAKQLLYVGGAASVIILIGGLLLHRPILSGTFGAVTPEVMANSQKYFIITLFALPGIAIYNSAAALFRAQGNSNIIMQTAVIANMINVCGNALLIFGLGCGVEGVALPTVAARTVGAVILIRRLRLMSDKSGAKVDIRGLGKIDFDGALIKKILSVGIPSGVENSMFQVGKLIVLSLIATYGTTAVAANAVTATLASFQVFPGASVGLAMLTVVGQCVGAGRKDEADRYVKRLVGAAYIGLIAINIPMVIFAPEVIGLYGLSDEVSGLAWLMTMTHGVCAMLWWPLSFTLPKALRASGHAMFTMCVSMATKRKIRGGLRYVFDATGIFGLIEAMGWPRSYGAEGTWLAMITDWLVRLSLFVWCYRRWMKKE